MKNSINFMSFKSTDEKPVIHAKDGNIEIMSNGKADEVIQGRFNHFYLYSETLPEKEDFYSKLNLEDITDADFRHTKRVI